MVEAKSNSLFQYIYTIQTLLIRLTVLIFYELNMLNKNTYHKIKKTRQFNYLYCDKLFYTSTGLRFCGVIP